MNFNVKNKRLKEYYYPNDEWTYLSFNTFFIIMKSKIYLIDGDFNQVDLFTNIKKS